MSVISSNHRPTHPWYWDENSQHYKGNEERDNKGPYVVGFSLRCTHKSWQQLVGKCCLCTSCINPNLTVGCLQTQISIIRATQQVENQRELSLWIQAKLSEHDIELERELHPVLLVTHSNVCLSRPQTDENYELSGLWGWLKQWAYRTYACVCSMILLLMTNNNTKDRDERIRQNGYLWQESQYSKI